MTSVVGKRLQQQAQPPIGCAGIMTLTRGPCDLDNMSLFQNLKLKRRKVDSRCSSDGESVADTSTSSPDLVPLSPKMSCEGHGSPEGVAGGGDGGGGGAPPTGPSPGPGPPTISPATSPVTPDRPISAPSPMPIATASPPSTPTSTPISSTMPSSISVSCGPGVIRSVASCSVIKSEGSPRQLGNVLVKREPIDPGCSLRTPQHPQHSPHSPHPPVSPQAHQHHLWMQTNRINGVKPELIGGNFPPAGLMHENRGPRNTPTVIMGESGGVRTMFWSPAPPAPSIPPISEATSPGIGGPSRPQRPSLSQPSDESAAQLLLGLGSTSHGPLNMERLWAGDLSQLPPAQQLHALNLSAASAVVSGQPLPSIPPPLKALVFAAPEPPPPPDEDDQPMICMICEDKATGLHYGIITCEGCKGFFKRTVQNRRVYTCVADGNCEITKAQRNRCQYCRFKKCIEQGMVLQAVREDRMPGGRNSGAVYNLYKVKYKKHKKTAQKAAPATSVGVTVPCGPSPQRSEPLANGTILKTALTNPSEIVHLRQKLESAVSSSSSREREWERERMMPAERAAQMIQALIDCDAMEDIATVQHLPDLLEDKSEIGDKLCKIGDSIVHKMVAWTKKLPFILEIPMKIHSKLLMDKWHEISVLTTAAYQAMHGKNAAPMHMQHTDQETELAQEVNANLRTLQTCLTTLMGRPITMEQLRLDVGLVVERMTQITIMFRRIKLRMEEYVCLKVYILLNNEEELEGIQERYVQALRSFLQHTSPHHPTRIHELFARIPEIQSAAALLLESKMFYVPFVLNSAEVR